MKSIRRQRVIPRAACCSSVVVSEASCESRGVLGVEDEVQPPRALANPGRVAPLNLERVIARIVTQHPARRPRELAVLREVSGPRADAGRRRVVPRAAPRHARFRRFEFEFRVVEELQRASSPSARQPGQQKCIARPHRSAPTRTRRPREDRRRRRAPRRPCAPRASRACDWTRSSCRADEGGRRRRRRDRNAGVWERRGGRFQPRRRRRCARSRPRWRWRVAGRSRRVRVRMTTPTRRRRVERGRRRGEEAPPRAPSRFGTREAPSPSRRGRECARRS